MRNELLTRLQIWDFAEPTAAPAATRGAVTLDLATANVFEVTLTEDVVTLVFADPRTASKAGSVTLILRQDAIGGRAVTSPGSMCWPRGVPPAISTPADVVDIFAFITRDRARTWSGFLGGKDFS
jgi:hypothetical protein